jgi:hypothetical protein
MSEPAWEPTPDELRWMLAGIDREIQAHEAKGLALSALHERKADLQKKYAQLSRREKVVFRALAERLRLQLSDRFRLRCRASPRR